jgi:signal transduction histidine kinase
MSSAPTLIEFPEEQPSAGDPLTCELLDAVALAGDPPAAMRLAVAMVRRHARAAGTEWWGVGEDGALTRVAASGVKRGVRTHLSLERAGVVVFFGGRIDHTLRRALAYVAPVIRRRINEEHLARAASLLARRNEALDEFATLVAHELKTPLQTALASEDPRASIGEALDLVDLILSAAITGPVGEATIDVGRCLERAVSSVGDALRVTSDLRVPVPVPPAPLFVILRNLLSNAAAAGARNVHVSTDRSLRRARLLVEDDGAGLDAGEAYAAGSGVGLALCRQIALRSGGVLELSARASSGSQATLTFALGRP